MGAFDTRRFDVNVGVSYDAALDQALKVVREVVENEKKILNEPEPLVAVTELADSSVNILVRVWVERGNYASTKFGLTKTIKEALDQNGIEIPFPQRVVHMVNQG